MLSQSTCHWERMLNDRRSPRLRIGYLLSTEARQRLAVVLPSGDLEGNVQDVRTLDRAIRAHEHDLFVVDPAAVTAASFARLLSTIEQVQCAILWYAGIDADRQILDAAQVGFGEFALSDRTQDAPAIRRRWAAARHGSPSAALLIASAAHLAKLPRPLRRALLAMLGGGTVPRTIAELAHEVGIPRRTLDRVMHRAGISTPFAFIEAAKVAISWPELENCDRLRNSDLEGLGYSTSRRGVQAYKRVLGLTPLVAAREFTTTEVCSRLTSYAVAR